MQTIFHEKHSCWEQLVVSLRLWYPRNSSQVTVVLCTPGCQSLRYQVCKQSISTLYSDVTFQTASVVTSEFTDILEITILGKKQHGRPKQLSLNSKSLKVDEER